MTPTLSIIIPVYNEAGTVAFLLDRVVTAGVVPGMAREIIVVNDGSTDGSRDAISAWIAAHPLPSGDRIMVLDKENSGKGSAVRAGIARSTGMVVIIQDADLEYDPADYAACVAPIRDGNAQVIYGSRELGRRGRPYSHLSFLLGGLLVTNWMNLLYGSELTDEPTCYKTFSGPLIRALSFSGNGFEWEPEVTAKLLRIGCEIREVPIAYQPRKTTEGKKIKWSDGAKALWTAWRWRWMPLKAVREQIAATGGGYSITLCFRQRRSLALGLILAVALLLRLGIALPGLTGNPAATFSRPDTGSYLGPALSLAQDGTYRERPDSARPATMRPPGFPLFLSWFVYGGNFSPVPAVLILCLLGAASCLPIFLAGNLFRGTPTIGLLAAGWFALNLTAIAAAPMLLSDTLFVFLVAWQVYFFLRFHFFPRILYLLLAVVLAALAALVRPINLLWLIPAIFLVLVHPGLELRRRLAYALAATALFAIILGPWLYRNHLAGAGFRLDSNIGDTLLCHNAAVLLATAEGGSPEAIRQEFRRQCEAEFAAHPDAYATSDARIRFMTAKAKAIIAQHPLLYARLHFRPHVLLPDVPSFLELLGHTTSGRGTFDVMNREGVLAAARHYLGGRWWPLLALSPLLAVVVVLYGGALLQFGCWLYRGEWRLVLLFLALAEYYLLLPGPIAMPRYQLPALPMLCVMAALATAALAMRWKRWADAR